jgi:hypothetical protein
MHSKLNKINFITTYIIELVLLGNKFDMDSTLFKIKSIAYNFLRYLTILFTK